MINGRCFVCTAFHLQNNIAVGISEAMQGIASWVEAMDKDLLGDFDAGHKSGFLKLAGEADQELREIWHQMLYDDILPKFEELQLVLTGPVTSMARRLSKHTWAHLAQLQHHYATVFGNMAKRTHQEISSIKNLFRAGRLELNCKL